MSDEREEIARIIDPEHWAEADKARGKAGGSLVAKMWTESSLAKADAILARQGPGPGEAVAYAINRLEIAVRFLRTTNAASETMVWDDAVCDGRCLADELESCAKALAATPTREA